MKIAASIAIGFSPKSLIKDKNQLPRPLGRGKGISDDVLALAELKQAIGLRAIHSTNFYPRPKGRGN